MQDLRRTACCNMVQKAKIPRAHAKLISGHLTDSMFERYNIVDPEDVTSIGRDIEKWMNKAVETVKPPRDAGDAPSLPSTYTGSITLEGRKRISEAQRIGGRRRRLPKPEERGTAIDPVEHAEYWATLRPPLRWSHRSGQVSSPGLST